MQSHILSKSTYIRGLQCHKSLFLYKNNIQLRDKVSPELRAIFNRGNKVGVIAQKLFPHGVDCSARSNIVAVENTLKNIEEGKTVLYEAAFNYNGTLAIIDILVKEGDKWFAYEVKSSLRLSQTYINDAALQYYVIKNSLPSLFDISLVYVNGTYVFDGKLDHQQLFSIQSVKKNAIEQWETIDARIGELKTVALDKKIPEIAIGEHCFSPYTCDFKGFCWKNISANSVFELTEMSFADKLDYYNKGLIYFSDLVNEKNLKPTHKIQIEAAVNNKPFVDVKKIKEFLSQVKYPLALFDIEAFMPAVPVFKGTKPYQHLPFLFSVHTLTERNSDLQEFVFIAQPGEDPRLPFAKNLVESLKDVQSILVYDAKMERQIINSLAELFPEYKAELKSISDRIVDLITPFENKWFYIKQMKGSNSLKNISAAVFAEIGFDKLNIPHGAVALAAYEDLLTENNIFKIMEVCEELKRYCQTDTLAMVKILEKLYSAAGC